MYIEFIEKTTEAAATLKPGDGVLLMSSPTRIAFVKDDVILDEEYRNFRVDSGHVPAANVALAYAAMIDPTAHVTENGIDFCHIKAGLTPTDLGATVDLIKESLSYYDYNEDMTYNVVSISGVNHDGLTTMDEIITAYEADNKLIVLANSYL